MGRHLLPVVVDGVQICEGCFYTPDGVTSVGTGIILAALAIVASFYTPDGVTSVGTGELFDDTEISMGFYTPDGVTSVGTLPLMVRL